MSPSTTGDSVAEKLYDQFVPESTRENYRQIARDIAKAEDSTPADGLAKLADGFDEQHERDPLGGWDYLAAWAREEGDPGDGLDSQAHARALARAIESAKRDPQVALQGSDEAVAAAVEALEHHGEERQDLVGVVANTGPAVGVEHPVTEPVDPEPSHVDEPVESSSVDPFEPSHSADSTTS